MCSAAAAVLLLAAPRAMAADHNECGALASTVDCTGTFNAPSTPNAGNVNGGIEYNPTGAQNPFTLNLGDASGTFTSVTAIDYSNTVAGFPTVVTTEMGNGITVGYGTTITDVVPFVLRTNVTAPAPVNTSVNVNTFQGSSIGAESHGIFVWTDGTGNNIQTNAAGMINAGEIGIVNHTGRSGGSAGAGNVTINHSGDTYAGQAGIVGWASNPAAGQTPDVTINNLFGGSIKSNAGHGIIVGDPGIIGNTAVGLFAGTLGQSSGTAHVSNSGLIDVGGNGIWTATTGDTTITNGAGANIIAGGDGIHVGGSLVFVPVASGAAATVDNAGTITAGQAGISVYTTTNANVTNAATGVITSAGNGISAASVTGSVFATNAGTITSTGGMGINANALLGDVTATNSAGGAIKSAGNGINGNAVAGSATGSNSGTIDAGGVGINLLAGGGTVTATNNAGALIKSVGNGINGNAVLGSATATNSGSIDAGGAGINLFAGGGSVTAINETGASITSVGAGISGIAAAGTAEATNKSTIKSGGDGVNLSAGVGDVTATNTAGASIDAGGDGINVTSVLNDAYVYNDGHIDADGDGIEAKAFGNVTVTNTSPDSVIAIGNGITVDAGLDANVTNSGAITVTNGIGIGTLALQNTIIDHSGTISSTAGPGIIALSGGDITIRGDGLGGTNFGSVQSDGVGILGIAGGNVTIDSGTVTSNNSTGIGAVAINGGSTVNLHGDVNAKGLFGVGSVALDLGSGTGDSIVDLGGKNVKNTGGIGVFSLALGGHSSVTGGGAGTITSADEGVISSAFLGNSTVDVNNVTSGGTGIISTAIGGNSVATAQGDIKSTSGSGIISTAIGGDAKATNNGEVTADNGLYGIAAFSIGGDATATANGKIDPPLIGVSSFTIGNGTATSDVNNTVQAWAVGAYAGNIGGGSVFVNVNPGGSIQSDYLGILATNIGPGDTTVNVKGAVGGYTGTATGDDAINVTNFINNGNISVTSNEDGTLNAGDDAVDITKLGGSGQINVTLGADATAADDGVTIFRTLSGVNTTDENNISVSLADGKTLTATNGNGIDISTPFANNDIAVDVGVGSSVLANNGTAVQVTGFSLLGDNNVTITNAGRLQGEGSFIDPTIRVATDGNVNINNTGTIQSDGGSTFASVIQSLAGGSNTVQNDGTIWGNMQLAAVGANTVNNTSNTTWNTSGLNLYVSATGNEVNNTSTGRINAGPFTVFAMIGPTNAINNAGEFNSTGLNVYGMLGNDNAVNNSGSFNVTGFTQFLGGNFIGQNLAFNNNGGVLSMQNGTSGYGFVTPVDLGFENYGNDIGDVVQIGVPNTTGNSFNGSGYSRYAIDTFLAAATTSASDLLIVNGDTTGVTALQVNDTNAGPGAYNPTGILVAHIEGNSDPDAFYLEGGPIDKGLFTYDLYRVQVSSFDWLLASTPDQTFFELPHLITAAQNMWHNSAGVWLDRTADLRSAATEKCAMMGSIKDSTPVCSRSVTPGAWAKVLGNTTEREQNYSWTILGKTSNFEVKSNQDGYGIVGGYDFGHETANGAWMIGAMGGYVASSLDFDGSTTDVDYRTGLVGAYATWIEGGLFIDGKVMANIGKYEYANYTNTGLSTHDKQDVLSVGGVIDTGYRMNYAGGFIEPGATLSYVEADLDNATIYGTTVNFEDGNSLRGRLGLRVGTSFVSGGHKVEPFIGASAWHEFEADNKATLSSGGYDLTAADDAGGTFGEVTGGLNVFSLGADGVSGFVKGNAQFGEDNLRGYAGSAGLRVNW